MSTNANRSGERGPIQFRPSATEVHRAGSGRPRVWLGALLIGLLASPSLSAMQGDQRGERDKRKDDKGKQEGKVEFDWPEGGGAGLDFGDVALPPLELIQRAMPSMISWPKDAGENAIRAVVVKGGPDLAPVLRNILRNGTVLERSASARALCLLKDQEALPDIEKLFFDRRQTSRMSALLFSLADLDAAHALELSGDYIASKSSVLRRAATQYYRSLPKPELAGLRRVLLDTELDEVRADVFQLLDDLDDLELTPVAVDHLGHPHAPMASAVADHLILHMDDALAATLVDAARADQDRRGLHALIVLSAAERRSRKNRVPAEFFEPMLSELRSSDPLLRATACIVCATVAYREEARAQVLQDTVLPALMDVVIRGRFFSDFRLCLRQAIGMLELVTGQRLGSSVPAWKEYWESSGGTRIGSLRELSAVRPEVDASSARIRYERPTRDGGWADELFLLGQNYRSQIHAPSGPEGIVLGHAAMKRLLEDLQVGQFFGSDLPREAEEVVPESRRLSVELHGRVRTLIAAGPDESMRRWEDSLWSAAKPSLWQTFLRRGEEFSSIFVQEDAWWSQPREAEDRVRRLIDLGIVALRDPATDRGRLVRVLERAGGFAEAVSPAQLRSLASSLRATPGSDGFHQEVFELVARHPSPEALDALLEVLEPRGERGREWIAEALKLRDGVLEGLQHSSAFVRQSALLALGTTEQFPEEPVTQLASADPDPLVRTRALDLLAARGSGLGADVLIEQASSAAKEIRISALRALGDVRDPRAMELLSAALFDSELAVAQAAIEGLGRRGDAGASDALSSVVVTEGVSTSRGFLAMAALRSMPEAVARPALRGLAQRGDADVAREARHGLAEMGDLSVVPFLLAELEDPARHRRALSKLSYLFCQDLSNEPRGYRALLDLHPEASQEQFFLTALRGEGHTIAEGVDPLDPELRPLLADVLEDERWYLRRSALELLEAGTGRSAGRFVANQDEEARKEFADAWRRILASEEG